MAKHISEDEVALTVNARVEKAQQNIRTFSKEIDRLGERNKSLQRQMESLELAGKKDTESWRQRRAEYGKNAAQVRNLKQQIADETKTLDLNALTMRQLRHQARDLQRQLDDTSRSINPDEWKNLSKRLTDVKGRMKELNETARGFKEAVLDKSTMSFFRGEMMVRLAELVGRTTAKMKDFVAESIDMAESADGVTHAFRNLDRPELLDNLRRATKGTVADIQLMKAAVKARDFNIPLEDLGKYLSFAQLKAQQTGQSLDYMVDSIVTGLGRKSPLILDNLGLSAAEISEKTKETGDFMKAVASIVENNLAAAGNTYVSAADRAAQKATALANKQRELGEALLPLREQAAGVFGAMKINLMQCVVWLSTHRKTTLALSLAVTALTVSMTFLNTAFRLWIKQTTIAKVVMAAWTATLTTLKGVHLLTAAAVNVMRGNMARATAQMRLFNTACKSNIILLVATALVAAGVAFYAFLNKTAQARKAIVDFNLAHARVAADIKRQHSEIEKSINDSTANEIAKVKTLQRTIHSTARSYNQRKKAIQEMQSIVPGYHASITKEGRLFNENTQAINTYIKNLRRAARAEAAYEQMKANEKKILNAQDTIDDATEKSRNVQNAAARRGVDLAAGEHVEARTQMVGTGSSGAVMTNTYHVVVDKTGKVIRNIDEATAKLILHDQQWDEMFASRTKAANDSVAQYTAQNDRLQKIVENNGGINQKFSPGRLPGGEKKKGKNTAPDTLSTNRFSHDRSQDLDEARQSYADDLNALKKALAEKRLTQEQYNAYATALNVQHQNNLLAIEQSYQERSRGLVMKDAARKKTLQEQQGKAVATQRQAADAAYLEAEKQYYDALDKIQQAAPGKPQTLQQECDAKLLVLDGYYQASLQLAKDDGERQKQATESYEAAKAAIKADYARKQQEEMARARQEYGLDTFEDQYAARRKKIDEEFAKGAMDRQQYEQALTNLEKQAEEHRLQIRQQYGLTSQQELYNAELEQLRQHLQNKELTEEEFEKAKKDMRLKYLLETFNYYRDLAGNAVKSLQDAEIANVEAKYDAEIEAARNAGRDTTELEKKKANDKLKIQKKYADVDFAMQASQIISNTAVAIMGAWATFKGNPVAAGIATGLISAASIAQLAAANAERQKVKKMTLNGSASAASGGARVATGLESGGSIDVERRQDGRLFHARYEPDKRGYVSNPTVIVGEGPYGRSKEWVASNAAVDNPTVAPILDIIDHAQRAGTIRTLDMNKFLAMQAAGRASGGSISTPQSGVANHPSPVPPSSSSDKVLERLIAVLDRISDEGIPASVALDELEQKQQLRDRSRRFGSK
ncbi:hypothetical protein HMPREF9135_0429 [Segatella baroniae F0067]|uniref:Uncharacterized protein n=1 Tax=Segatella baroniae F0067 TaxID=1115809 RepID=U2QNJ7_9BACT|nr:hypothetical protein [Segatella baroniae]ERK40362.1 hypothetical protein HMPREF9135_0429 [Segatella baroniae F0067]